MSDKNESTITSISSNVTAVEGTPTPTGEAYTSQTAYVPKEETTDKMYGDFLGIIIVLCVIFAIVQWIFRRHR